VWYTNGLNVILDKEVGLGSRIKVRGVVKEISWQGKKIYNLEQVKILEYARGWWGWEGLGELRIKSLRLWQAWLPGDVGGLVSGIVWGGQSEISSDLRNKFATAGMTHVLAASGYNLTLVANWISRARWWGRRKMTVFVLVCMLGYVFLAGMTTAVWRSAIMSAGGLIGKLVGRKSNGWWWLLLAVAIMWLIDPLVIEDIGFQLSVLAVVAILMWPNCNEWQTTVAVTVFTWPILGYYFGRVSLIAPVASLGLLWLVPLIMNFGIIATLGGWVWQKMGAVLAMLVWPWARLLKWGVETVAKLPGADLQVEGIGMRLIVGYYILLIGLIWLHRRRSGFGLWQG
jgi:competence protein ComEC